MYKNWKRELSAGHQQWEHDLRDPHAGHAAFNVNTYKFIIKFLQLGMVNYWRRSVVDTTKKLMESVK